MREFRKELKDKMEQLRMDPEFARRYVNDGFSGGEMKRAEILQLAMLRPKFAILDETDSGLDVDAVRLASQSIAEIGGAEMGILIITHHEQAARTQPARLHARDARRPDRRDRRRRSWPSSCTSKGYDRIRAALSRRGRRRSGDDSQTAEPVGVALARCTRATSNARRNDTSHDRTKASTIMATDLVANSARRHRRNQQVRFPHRVEVRLQGPQGPRCARSSARSRR